MLAQDSEISKQTGVRSGVPQDALHLGTGEPGGAAERAQLGHRPAADQDAEPLTTLCAAKEVGGVVAEVAGRYIHGS